MKWPQIILVTNFTTLICLGIYAQHPKLIKGDLSSLRTEISVNVQFTYDSMMVGNMTEVAYMTQKMDEYNKKEAGKGDVWAKEWIDNRKNFFDPEFNKLFQKYSNKTISDKAKYTLICHTVYTEPGFFGTMLVSKSTRISIEVTVVESADSSHLIAKLSMEKVDASETHYDAATNIKWAYHHAGKILGDFVKK